MTVPPGFGSYNPTPTHSGMTVESVYVPMRDGVRLAVDIHLPASRGDGERLPTLVYITRYWRAIDYRAGFKRLDSSTRPWEFLTAHGYAVVTVDARGTGASFGTRRHEWDKEEVKDGADLAQWITEQPWSNGVLGATGTSYSGTTAELFAAPNHPAVKAVLPRFNEFDPYTDIAFPGGLYLRGFVDTWSSSTTSLDNNLMPDERSASTLEKFVMRLAVRGVKPVDADADRALLRQAVAEHKANVHAAEISHGMTYRDDDVGGISNKDFSVYAYRDAIERSGVAIYGWGGWMDAVTADAVIRRWQTVNARQMAVVGAWNHGAGQHASPFAPGRSDTLQHWNEFLRFFDYTLKDIDTGIAAELDARTLTYFTMGEERWKSTTVFPPPDAVPQAWYFAEGGTLSTAAPTGDGDDSFTVDFGSTTGKTNRWYTQLGGGAVIYEDRATADRGLLTYASAPLEADLEITGYPVVTLHLSSTATDGAIFVYLEVVKPDDSVIYLTEGELRLLHRSVSDDEPPYAQPVPYHSFNRADGQPLTPGEMTTVTFGLLPTSVLLRRGDRICVALAGADNDLFPRIPAEGSAPTLTISRAAAAPSHITLPVISHA